jgi:microcystin-dependent protein
MVAYTSSNRFTLQDTGSNPNTWGDVANMGVFALIEDSLDGLLNLDVTTGSSFTLTTANGATDESRNRRIRLTGTPTSTIRVNLPNVNKWYIVDASISGTSGVMLAPTGGTGPVIMAGQKRGILAVDTSLAFFVTTDTSATTSTAGITRYATSAEVTEGTTVSTAAVTPNLLDYRLSLFTTIEPGSGSIYFGSTAPSGYVLASGRTIGNATSGGTERANSDTEDLFILLWDAYSNSILPVSGGRGATAAADFAASKTITLPDLRGRVPVGKDDMGGTAANRITTSIVGISGITLGASGGQETTTASIGNMPNHAHTRNPTGVGENAIQIVTGGAFTTGTPAGSNAFLNAIVSTGSTGGGAAMTNVQPSLVVNYIIKL